MRLYDTLSRTIKEIMPLSPPTLKMYCCGPTVYSFTHLGHLRKYMMDDILKRALILHGFTVEHVMNITDVGHLTDDADSGEDKMEKGARKDGITVWDVVKKYTDYFHIAMESIGVARPQREPRVTDHIEDIIALIKRLEKKGYTYLTEEALYFDTSRFLQYGSLSGQKIEDKLTAVREEVHADASKKHPADFSLWFFRKGRFATHTMHWDSPWGDGFPGWHIECSALAINLLGEQIDIHTGGVDHIPVHHENEIAQSECAFGKTFAQIWVHHNWLLVEGKKMSKSLENFYTFEDIIARGLEPMALRLLFPQTHYRQELNFTWDSLKGAHEAYLRLLRIYSESLQLSKVTDRDPAKLESQEARALLKRFTEALGNDLQTPVALSVVWETAKKRLSARDTRILLSIYSTALGLHLDEKLHLVAQTLPDQIPQQIQDLLTDRNAARSAKDFALADSIRMQIEEHGFRVLDGQEGSSVEKIH